MPIHVHSLAAFQALNIGQRRAVVLSIYAESDEPLTDRQAAARIEGAEFGNVKPRITDLVNDQFLYEVDSVICEVTGRRVRRCSYTGLVNPA